MPIEFRSLALLFCLAPTALLAPLNAEIYQWTDAEGVTHFSDSPPDGSFAEKKELQINSGVRFASEEQLEAARQRRQEAANKRDLEQQQRELERQQASAEDRRDAEAILKAKEQQDEKALREAVDRAAARKVKERRRAIYRQQQNN